MLGADQSAGGEMPSEAPSDMGLATSASTKDLEAMTGLIQWSRAEAREMEKGVRREIDECVSLRERNALLEEILVENGTFHC